MTRVADVFVNGLVAHLEEESAGEAGRYRELCTGAAIALGYSAVFGTLESTSTEPLTLEQVQPDALVIKDCPLVALFYGAAEDVY